MWKYVVVGIIVLIALCSLWPQKPTTFDIVDLTLVAIAEKEAADLIQLFDPPYQTSEEQAQAFLDTVEEKFWPVVYSPLATVSHADLAVHGMKSPLEWYTEPIAKLTHQPDAPPEGSVQIISPLEAVNGRKGLLVLYTLQDKKDLIAIELLTEPETPHPLPTAGQSENAASSEAVDHSTESN